MSFAHERWSEDDGSTEYGYFRSFEPWRPWWYGDAAEGSLVRIAERAVQESSQVHARQMTLDESNGLLMVLAGSLIFDIVRQIGGALFPLGSREEDLELPAWIRDEQWSFDDDCLEREQTASATLTNTEPT